MLDLTQLRTQSGSDGHYRIPNFQDLNPKLFRIVKKMTEPVVTLYKNKIAILALILTLNLTQTLTLTLNLNPNALVLLRIMAQQMPKHFQTLTETTTKIKIIIKFSNL